MRGVVAEQSGDQKEEGSSGGEAEEAIARDVVEEAIAEVDTEAVDLYVGSVNMQVIWRWI